MIATMARNDCDGTGRCGRVSLVAGRRAELARVRRRDELGECDAQNAEPGHDAAQ